MDKSIAKERVQSLGEEIANSVSHGVGFVLAAAATPCLIAAAVNRGTVASVVGVSIFAATMMLMYLIMISMPIKMLLRWTLDLQYIVNIQELFLNI